VSEALTTKARLQEELVHLAAHIHDIRAAFGNPFYYSHPEEPDEGVEHYTGNSSHGVGLQTLLDYMRLEKTIGRLTEQLNAAERVEP
jgi:hypothetical protein